MFYCDVILQADKLIFYFITIVFRKLVGLGQLVYSSNESAIERLGF